MNYRFRRPELIPTIAVLVTAALMFTLGVWQLERLQWKNALLASIEEAQSQAPRDLLSYPASALPAKEWYNIRVTGYLLSDKELHVTPRYYNGQMGYAILTPLAIATHHGMQYILVNRGWVPPEKVEPRARAGDHTAKAVTVEGVLRNPYPQGFFRPNNNPQRNLWFWYDIPAMSKLTGLPLMNVTIDASQIKVVDGPPIKDAPVPFPLEIKIRNDHLGYAITWFLIGISALVMYGMYYVEKKT